jgi:hypothetical protein
MFPQYGACHMRRELVEFSSHVAGTILFLYKKIKKFDHGHILINNYGLLLVCNR